jgi:hypothetical protein
MKIKAIWWLSMLLLSSACVPRAAAPDPYTVPFIEATSEVTNQLLEPFTSTLSSLGITVSPETAKAYRYEGNNDTAFLAAIDRFYLENPGFCPLEKAFYYADNKTTLITLFTKIVDFWRAMRVEEKYSVNGCEDSLERSGK